MPCIFNVLYLRRCNEGGGKSLSIPILMVERVVLDSYPTFLCDYKSVAFKILLAFPSPAKRLPAFILHYCYLLPYYYFLLVVCLWPLLSAKTLAG